MLGILKKLMGSAAPAPAPAAEGAGAASAPIDIPVEQYNPEVVDQMAAEMSDQQGVWWAAQSAHQVEDQMPPADTTAVRAAEAWVKDPSDQTRQTATEAAQATDFQSPGAWAAQAAGWSGEEASLTSQAVAGAVKLAAATASSGQAPQASEFEQPVTDAASQTLSAEDQTAQAEALKPFIDMGRQIQEGTLTWQ